MAVCPFYVLNSRVQLRLFDAPFLRVEQPPTITAVRRAVFTRRTAAQVAIM
jgi:hypothetical protein